MKWATWGIVLLLRDLKLYIQVPSGEKILTEGEGSEGSINGFLLGTTNNTLRAFRLANPEYPHDPPEQKMIRLFLFQHNVQICFLSAAIIKIYII